MKRRLFLLFSIVLALAVSGISYASTQATKEVTVSSGEFATVSKAGTDGVYSNDFNAWKPATGVSGTTGSGDLYIITRPADATGDLYGTLYLSNAASLSEQYSYLNLNVNIYGFDSVSQAWQDINAKSDGTLTTKMLSLTNGYVTFQMSGTYEKYAVSVDGGSYYCISAGQGDVLSPEFFVEIR
ncbi:MAG TPA: hypothetical protein VFJ73_02375 [Bacillales bacterium]|nr:hypothetical protein [Bacillales bacterium]